TKHHLIPRTRHRNKRVKKLYSREEMARRLLWVCRPCHHHIHRVMACLGWGHGVGISGCSC
ncbi:MAG: hypothetical protein WD601_06105, partial [Pseudohongiellaceae bacterium]